MLISILFESVGVLLEVDFSLGVSLKGFQSYLRLFQESNSLISTLKLLLKSLIHANLQIEDGYLRVSFCLAATGISQSCGQQRNTCSKS